MMELTITFEARLCGEPVSRTDQVLYVPQEMLEVASMKQVYDYVVEVVSDLVEIQRSIVVETIEARIRKEREAVCNLSVIGTDGITGHETVPVGSLKEEPMRSYFKCPSCLAKTQPDEYKDGDIIRCVRCDTLLYKVSGVDAGLQRPPPPPEPPENTMIDGMFGPPG